MLLKFRKRKARDPQLDENKKTRAQLRSDESKVSKFDEPVFLSGDSALAASETPSVDKSPLDVNYEFGDRGSGYRMRKLNRCLEEGGAHDEEVVRRRYGSVYEFQIALEERDELDKKAKDPSYTVKKKPDGVYIDGIQDILANMKRKPSPLDLGPEVSLTQLNDMKAAMLKAKLKQQKEAFAQLEKEYSALERRYNAQQEKPTKESIENKEESQMNVQELLLKEQLISGEQYDLQNAKSIARDADFENDIDYMDDTQVSNTFEITRDLRGIRKAQEEPCIYCLDNDTHLNNDLVLSLGEHSYVCLNFPTVNVYRNSPASLAILTINHRRNVLEAFGYPEEEKEIRTYMDAIRDYYKASGFAAIFYESCLSKHRHSMLKAIAVPAKDIKALKGYFRNEILSSGVSNQNSGDFDDQGVGNGALLNDLNASHQVLIDTDVLTNKSGKSVKSLIAKESDYFHVWLSKTGGYGHIIDEEERGLWPVNEDLFVKRVIGGFLGKDKLEIENVNDPYFGNFRKPFSWKAPPGGTNDYTEDAVTKKGQPLDGTLQKLIEKVNELWLQYDPLLK